MERLRSALSALSASASALLQPTANSLAGALGAGLCCNKLATNSLTPVTVGFLKACLYAALSHSLAVMCRCTCRVHHFGVPHTAGCVLLVDGCWRQCTFSVVLYTRSCYTTLPCNAFPCGSDAGFALVVTSHAGALGVSSQGSTGPVALLAEEIVRGSAAAALSLLLTAVEPRCGQTHGFSMQATTLLHVAVLE